MASSGPLYPADDATNSGAAGISWTGLANVKASDNSYANNSLAAGEKTKLLRNLNYGFAIPTGATINGIVVEVEMKTLDLANRMNDDKIQLVKAGTAVGSNYARADTVDWPTSDTFITYGGATDLWGTTWTYSDINATNFGVDFAANCSNGTAERPRIDTVRVTVYYTVAGTTGFFF